MAQPNSIIEAQVAIVGAGPAGAAAAVHLGQLGVSDVVLVDRSDFPRDKTCGSGLSPKGIESLKSLGVWDQVQARSYPIEGLRLVTRKDQEVMLSGGEKAAAVICSRRVLDEMLVRRAQSLGVKFLPKFWVRSLSEANGRVRGAVAADGREIRARFTLIADGGHSRLVPEREPRQLLQAIMGWWDGVPFHPRHVEMVFDPLVAPHYGWLFPESSSRVNIGICYRDDEHKHNARDLFRRFLDRQYGRRLKGATQVGEWKGHPILYSFRIRKLHSPGRLVLGEAGRMTHPATGEGIYHGMRTGEMAAEAVRDVIAGTASEGRAFAQYQARCRRAFGASFWGSKLFHALIQSSAIDWAVQVSRRPLVKRVAGSLMAKM